MPPVALNAIEYAARSFRHLAVDAVQNKLGVAENCIERRTQLVAHIGEELRFVLASLRKLAAFVLDFVEQAHVLDGDDRLIGKRSDQFDLLGRERTYNFTYNFAAKHDHADRLAFA